MSDEQPTQPARRAPAALRRLVAELIAVVAFVVAYVVPLPGSLWGQFIVFVLVGVYIVWAFGETRRDRLVLVACLTGVAVIGYWVFWTSSGHDILVGTVPGISCPTESSGVTNLPACTRGEVPADASQCEPMGLRWLYETAGASQRAVSDFGPLVVRKWLAVPGGKAIFAEGLTVPTGNAPVPPPGETQCIR